MPSTIDITPTTGHGLLETQAGVGAAPGFDAIDRRRWLSLTHDEGVASATAWKVSETAGAPSMAVAVAANVDMALVQGDAISQQGLYAIAPHSGVATLTVAAADATNPRIDLIVLRAYDDTHDGSTFNKATLEIIAGAASAGADHDNLTGAPAVPGSAILLATLLVRTGAVSVLNTDLRDRRDYALRKGEIGETRFFTGGLPAGWAEKNGALLKRNQYKRLFDYLGTAYGAGDGTTTFGTPDQQGRAVVGAGQGTGLTNRAVGATGGEETHALTVGEMPSHDHGAPTAPYTTAGGSNTSGSGIPPHNGVPSGSSWTLGAGQAGGGAAHNNMQPFLVERAAIFTGCVATPA